MKGQTDRAGVIFPPPLVALVALIAAVALHYFWPLPVTPRPAALVFGSLFVLCGVATAAWGRVMLVRGGTNVNPYKPTTSIITAGPYRFTRNALYIGLQSLLLGLSLLAGTWWGLIFWLPTFLVLHFGVVLREEAYLERKFGEVYLSCKKTVRRWL